MSQSSDFEPGEKLPAHSVMTLNLVTWARWLLPVATGLALALIILSWF